MLLHAPVLAVFPLSCAASYFCRTASGKSSLIKPLRGLLVPNKARSTLNWRTRLIMVQQSLNVDHLNKTQCNRVLQVGCKHN